MADKTKGLKEQTEEVIKEAEAIKTLPPLPDELTGHLKLQKEDNQELLPHLQAIADRERAVCICFIATHYGKRVSQTKSRWASIGLFEEFGIEKIISEVSQEWLGKDKPKLFLLVNTQGGAVNSSFAIARMIRKNFGSIKVFIPQEAASGGTLISLAGNKIVMGRKSRLSPIDTQLYYKGHWVSAQSIDRAIEDFDRKFGTKTADEIPYPYQVMIEKLDPILWEEWKAKLYQMGAYARQILQGSNYSKEKIDQIIFWLIWSQYPHDFFIDRERAKDVLGLEVESASEDLTTWQVMESWLSLYLPQGEDQHIIRYVMPAKVARKE